MSYSYQIERPKLFTDAGQRAFLKARDKAFRLLSLAGAFNGMNAVADVGAGDTFVMMAILDRMVELGDGGSPLSSSTPRTCSALSRAVTASTVRGRARS